MPTLSPSRAGDNSVTISGETNSRARELGIVLWADRDKEKNRRQQQTGAAGKLQAEPRRRGCPVLPDEHQYRQHPEQMRGEAQPAHLQNVVIQLAQYLRAEVQYGQEQHCRDHNDDARQRAVRVIGWCHRRGGRFAVADQAGLYTPTGAGESIFTASAGALRLCRYNLLLLAGGSSAVGHIEPTRPGRPQSRIFGLSGMRAEKYLVGGLFASWL